MKNLLHILLSCFSGIFTCPVARCFSPVRMLLEKTAALDHLLLYLIRVALCLTAALALSCISNHNVLSLDILAIFAGLMLVLYHLIENQKASIANL